MRSEALPVVAIGKDSDGRPTRLSIPVKLTRPVPVVSAGQRVGEVAVDGSVTWVGPGAARNWWGYVAHNDALKRVARSRRELLASVIDGKVAAITVPPARKVMP